MKTILLICSNLHAESTIWYQNILVAHEVGIDFCCTMSELHEKIPKKHKNAVIVDEELPHTNSKNDFSTVGEIISLLAINNIDYLIVSGKNPDTPKILGFIEKNFNNRAKKESAIIYQTGNIMPEMDSSFNARD